MPLTLVALHAFPLDARMWGFVADAATSVLAIPANTQLPNSGNLLTYVFRAASPGTYAYGWSYSSHLGHTADAGTDDYSSGAR